MEVSVMFKVAVVGAGFMGQTHSDGYAKMKDVKIAGIVDKMEEPRKALAAKHGAKDFETLDQCLNELNPDFVDICVPTNFNLPLVRETAAAKKDMVLEKPIALTLKEADEIIKIVEAASVKFMVAHVLRFWPDYVLMKKLFSEGKIGKPLSAMAQRVCCAPPQTRWYRDPKMGAGAVLNLVIHDFDTLNWFFGKPTRVYATGHWGEFGALDDLTCTISYPNGVDACVEGSFLMPFRWPFTMGLRVLGDKGALEFLFRASLNLEEREKARKELVLVTATDATELKSEDKDGYHAELEYFVECLKANKHPETITPADARLALEVGLACVKSVKTGKPVAIK
jgi:predicted dehydrogenase